MELDSRQRQYLKGLAHHLKPVVHIGKDGLTPALLAQIEGALLAHELIKVKLGDGAPLDRKEAAEALPAKTGAAFVQNVGKVFVLYRRHPEEPRIDLPAPRRDEEAEEGGGDEALALGLPQSVRRRGPAETAAPSDARPPRRDRPSPRPRSRKPAARHTTTRRERTSRRGSGRRR